MLSVLRRQRFAWCWLVGLLAGCNDNLPLDPDRSNRPSYDTPPGTPMVTVGDPAPQIAAGELYTCALRANGTGRCWGANPYGAHNIPPTATFTQLSGGFSTTCGLLTNSSIQCWGSDGSGQNAAPAGSFAQASIGQYHGCALALDGTLNCWGLNAFHAKDLPPGIYAQVSAGWLNSCAIDGQQSIVCSGNGYPNNGGTFVPPSGAFQRVSAGEHHACAVRTDEAIVCWGSNGFGEVGGTPTGAFTTFAHAGNFVDVRAAQSHTCALATSGTISCWGYNVDGRATPPAGTFAQVAAGRSHSCALRADRTISCWGDNSKGQIVVPSEFARANTAPTVSAGGPYGGLKNAPVTFAPSAADADGDALSYSWVFGDGNTGSGAAGVHSYVAPGLYSATVTVTDAFGASASATASVVISDGLNGMLSACGYNITGAAFDGTNYYMADGHDGGTCITRFSAQGLYLDHKNFVDHRGLHFVSATGKLVTRRYNGPLVQIDYPNGTAAQLTNFSPTPDDQAQPAADPDGLTYWALNGGNAERRRLSDNSLTYPFTVQSDATVSRIAVSTTYVIVPQGNAVNAYNKTTGQLAGTVSLSSTSIYGYGLGMSLTADRVIYAQTNRLARVEMMHLNSAPTVAAGGPYAGLKAAAVAFVATASDPDGDVVTYSWDFGDGSTGSGATPTHSYATPGVYTATVTVTDPSAATALATVKTVISDGLQALPGACSHSVTGVAHDGTNYYVAEGHDGLLQCITRYSSSGLFEDYKQVSVDHRGLHFVPSTGKLVSRTWAGRLIAIDYATGTISSLTGFSVMPGGSSDNDQNSPAADPDGQTFWVLTAGRVEHRRITDNSVLQSFPVQTDASPSRIAVSNSQVFVPMGTGVNAYNKSTGAFLANVPFTAINFYSYGLGASLAGDRIMYVQGNGQARVDLIQVNAAPVAAIRALYHQGQLGAAVQFDASGSTDSDGDALTYKWTFGDGDTGAGVTPSHAYAVAGAYQVNLTVTDARGAQASAVGFAAISNGPSALVPACSHSATGIAFDGTYIYVAEGHDGVTCLARYTAQGVFLDYKNFFDHRGLHYVPASGKLVSRAFNGPLYEIDYAAGTLRQLTGSIAAADPQNQPAADPDGKTYWVLNGTQAERRRISDGVVARAFAVSSTAANPTIAVSFEHVFLLNGSTVNVYNKNDGALLGSRPLPTAHGCNGYGFGAAATGDRVMYVPACRLADAAVQVAPFPPGTTGTGSNVSVTPLDSSTGQPGPAGITFGSVTTGGQTTVTSGTLGQTGSPPPPGGFRLGQPGTYYDISTTAVVSGMITVCINYESVSYTDYSTLQLLHYNAGTGAWENITRTIDSSLRIICGTTTSLSPFLVAQRNLSPVIGALTLPIAPMAVGTSVELSATFGDADLPDLHTATVIWSDGVTSPATVSEANGAGTIGASRTFTKAGVYTLTVRISDGVASTTRSSAEESTTAFVVVFDPNAGFVTGGGWINSPYGACRFNGCNADGSTIGKATFGFVSRYQKGANVPIGNSEFQFKAGGLTFSSTSYDWLVVAGTKAQFKGIGTIAGSTAQFGFMITAVDGGSSEPDQFRIKIWQVDGDVVYDNQIGEPEDSAAATALGGGSIVIHNK
ncbi:MAG: PKD domain-containing protein [Gemmatimonadota bacterium]